MGGGQGEYRGKAQAMSLPIAFRWQARQELEGAVDWYERERPGLGARFQGRVDEVLDRISRSPEMHGRVHGDIRCARVPRFPYGVYNCIEPVRRVVIAVFDGKRDPDVWQRRV